ncbi:hypothetical protein Pcinc_036685, partial [Petrolisthes cinctipes]
KKSANLTRAPTPTTIIPPLPLPSSQYPRPPPTAIPSPI